MKEQKQEEYLGILQEQKQFLPKYWIMILILYMNIQHLEHLFKIQVFLSIVSPNYGEKQNYLLNAFHVLRKIIEISLTIMIL